MGNWKQRKVAFVVADDWNDLTLCNVTMPVREAEITDGMTRYEGPVEAMWQKTKHRIHDVENMRLVGVMIASSSKMDEGNITWLTNSVHRGMQEGADKIKEVV